MLKVTVLYPATDDSTFDVEYYRTKHAEIVHRVLKPERFDIDRGRDGQPFHALGHLYYPSSEAMKAGMGGPTPAKRWPTSRTSTTAHHRSRSPRCSTESRARAAKLLAPTRTGFAAALPHLPLRS